MSVLVAGGAGFIGSVTVDHLIERGQSVVVLDDLSTGYRDNVNAAATLEVGDISDAAYVSSIVTDHGVTAAILFAGKIAVGESVREPSKYYVTNVSKAIALCDTLVAAGVAELVYSSSAAVYGDPESVPIPETHRQAPTSPYGWTKAMVEQVLRDYDVGYGLRSVSLRYFNAAGGTPVRRERHEPETHLIPLVLNVAAGTSPEIRVFGSDYPTPDGSAVRDYIHVDDLARAHLAALDHLRSGGTTQSLNLGTGSGYSVIEVIDRAEQVTGRSIRRTSAARREGDPAILVADPSAARQILDWHATDSSIDHIIQSAWQHY